MKEIINKLFNRKSCHQEDHEALIRYSERLCNAQNILRDRENEMQRVCRDAIKLVGVFDPDKMMEFYRNHPELEKLLPIIW